eukprot:1286996-Rhodomonas_salina.1
MPVKIASSRRLSNGAGSPGAVPPQAVTESALLLLPGSVLGHFWPAERGVVGLRVCKQLRRDLMAYSTSITLVLKAGPGAPLSEHRVRQDFQRLPEHIMVTLICRGKLQGASDRWLLGTLKECKGLAHLDLSDNGMGDEGVEMLAGALGDCKALVHLDLGGNRMGDEAVGRLLEVLGECKALAHLNLGRNRLGAGGARMLARVLREWKALAHLDLCFNTMGHEGAGMLAGVLGECKALAHLDLSDTDIGPEGVGMLAGVLGECKALVHLNLRGNRIGHEGARMLASAPRVEKSAIDAPEESTGERRLRETGREAG